MLLIAKFHIIKRHILLCGILLLLPHVALGQPQAVPQQLQDDTELLRSANVAVDGPALLEFFQKRILKSADPDVIREHIANLGDERYVVRQEASDSLMTIGYPAKEFLKDALTSRDIEVIRQAERCLRHIDRVADPSYLAAAVRVLAHRNPPGSTEVLLDFAEATQEELVLEEMGKALAKVGFDDHKPDPLLETAVSDPLATKRSVVGEAFVRNGGEKNVAVGLGLLKDRDEQVRKRVALALVEADQKESIPVLIDLLAELSTDKVWKIEDALYRIARDDSPNVVIEGTLESRHAARDAWKKWWVANAEMIDLTKVKLKPALKGLTLVTVMDRRQQKSKVLEVDAKGKVQWEIVVDSYPTSAYMLPTGNVIVGDYRTRTVKEYTRKGKVVWTKTFPTSIMAVQALRNGNIFVATRSQLIELDKDRKPVYTINRSTIYAAHKMRNGNIAIVDSSRRFLRLSTKGKVLHQFQVGSVYSSGSQLDVMPTGRVLIPLYSNSKVVEYDARGKVLWHATVSRPTSVFRLPNGNALVGCRTTRRVVEIDRKGREVWSYTADGYVMGVSRR